MIQPLSDDIQHLVNYLHLKKAHLKNDELYCLCINPYHKDTNPTNFSINLQTGDCFCFACLYKNNIVNLLWVNTGSYNYSTTLWNKLRQEFKRSEKIYIPQAPLPLSYVNLYKRNGVSKYALGRIPDSDQLEKYGVYSDENDNPIFLIKDWSGQDRAIWVRENGKYYLIHPEESKKDGWLYGQHLPPTDYNVLTEGFFDAIAVNWRIDVRAVAGMGIYLSPNQIKNLSKMGRLFVMFDGDYRGRQARINLHRYTRHMDIWFCGGYNCDPDELSKEKLEKAIETAKSWTEFDRYIKRVTSGA